MAWSKERQAEYYAAWRLRNRERLRVHQAKWRAANRTTARARVAKFNREKGAEYTARYRDKHRARLAERHSKRRAIEIRATPRWANPIAIAEIYTEAQRRKREVDHVVPLQSKRVCGLHCEANMRLLTRRQNSKKSNRHWPGMWPIVRVRARLASTPSLSRGARPSR